MSTVTAATDTVGVPSSRVEQDPERVARGEPQWHVDGVPVYRWGQAPPYLRTQTQLVEDRLRLAEGQQVMAYITTRKFGEVSLYDPAGAVRMAPLPSSTKRLMTERRTCPQCGTVRRHIVRGKQCGACELKAAKVRQRLEARTCWGCREVFARKLPLAHHRCGGCRRKQLADLRAQAAAWVERVTVCAKDGCTVKVVTKKEAAAFQRKQGLGRSWWQRDTHWALRCPPCTAAEERRRAEERAAYERRELERAEAARREAEERVRWAAAALADPDVVVLDTETSGLHDTARVVELAVVSSRGDVLLNSLLDPGEPIPADASAIHHIGDADVQGAPPFSDVLVNLTTVLYGKRCLIYNASYDIGRLRHELTLHYAARATRAVLSGGLGPLTEDAHDRAMTWARSQAAAWLDAQVFEDVMIPYSDWVGDWSEYHGNNRWQPLDGGHRAAGDCRAVLDCLRAMAKGREFEISEGGS